MSAKRASMDAAEQLHALQCATLQAEIKRYTDNVDKDGKPDPLPVPPALLAQVNKFLKDNGIDSPAAAKKLNDELGRRLPDLEEVDEVHTGYVQ